MVTKPLKEIQNFYLSGSKLNFELVFFIIIFLNSLIEYAFREKKTIPVDIKPIKSCQHKDVAKFIKEVINNYRT